MKRQEILDMVAGGCLDKTVVENLFKSGFVFNYSSNLASSWVIVDLLRKSGIYLTITMDRTIYRIEAYSEEHMDDIEELEGESLPLLICKIALLCNMYDFVTLEV